MQSFRLSLNDQAALGLLEKQSIPEKKHTAEPQTNIDPNQLTKYGEKKIFYTTRLSTTYRPKTVVLSHLNRVELPDLLYQDLVNTGHRIFAWRGNHATEIKVKQNAHSAYVKHSITLGNPEAIKRYFAENYGITGDSIEIWDDIFVNQYKLLFYEQFPHLALRYLDDGYTSYSDQFIRQGWANRQGFINMNQFRALSENGFAEFLESIEKKVVHGIHVHHNYPYLEKYFRQLTTSHPEIKKLSLYVSADCSEMDFLAKLPSDWELVSLETKDKLNDTDIFLNSMPFKRNITALALRDSPVKMDLNPYKDQLKKLALKKFSALPVMPKLEEVLIDEIDSRNMISAIDWLSDHILKKIFIGKLDEFYYDAETTIQVEHLSILTMENSLSSLLELLKLINGTVKQLDLCIQPRERAQLSLHEIKNNEKFLATLNFPQLTSLSVIVGAEPDIAQFTLISKLLSKAPNIKTCSIVTSHAYPALEKTTTSPPPFPPLKECIYTQRNEARTYPVWFQNFVIQHGIKISTHNELTNERLQNIALSHDQKIYSYRTDIISAEFEHTVPVVSSVYIDIIEDMSVYLPKELITPDTQRLIIRQREHKLPLLIDPADFRYTHLEYISLSFALADYYNAFEDPLRYLSAISPRLEHLTLDITTVDENVFKFISEIIQNNDPISSRRNIAFPQVKALHLRIAPLGISDLSKFRNSLHSLIFLGFFLSPVNFLNLEKLFLDLSAMDCQQEGWLEKMMDRYEATHGGWKKLPHLKEFSIFSNDSFPVRKNLYPFLHIEGNPLLPKPEPRWTNAISTGTVPNDTVENPNKVCSVDPILRPNSSHHHPRDFRQTVYTDLIVTKDELKLVLPSLDTMKEIRCPLMTLTEFEAAEKKYQENKNYLFTDYEIILNHEWKPLTTLGNAKIEGKVPTLGEKDIVICRYPLTRQYYAKLSEKNAEKERKVQMRLILNTEKMIHQTKTSLNAAINTALSFDLKGTELILKSLSLEEIKKIPLAERLEMIIAHCVRFSSGETKPELKGLAFLNHLFQNRFGSCFHRAVVFMALAKTFEIPCQLIKNECHIFPECLENDEWRAIELGGFKMKVTTKETPAQQRLKQAIPPLPPRSLPVTMDFKTYYSTLENQLKEFPHKLNLLINTLSSERILAIHELLRELITARGKQYFYIDDLDNIQEKAFKVVNGRPQITTSDLIEFLRTACPGSVLLVNWTEFQAHHVGFNTLMDDKRELNSIPVPEGVIVICILDKTRCQLSEDFESRFSVVDDLSENVSLATMSFKSQAPSGKRIHSVNCYGGDQWETQLNGVIRPRQGQWEYVKGELDRALEAKYQGIELINAPWNFRAFKLFISDWLFQHRTDDFCIVRKDENYKLSANPVSTLDWNYVLNPSTYSQFFSQYHSEKGQINFTPGWLETSPITVLVTQPLNDNEAARIQHYAQSKKQTVTFVTTKESYLPELLRNKKCEVEKQIIKTWDEKKPPSSITVFNSADIYYTTEKLSPNTDYTISIHENMTFYDLWESIESQGANTALHAKASQVFQWLKTGKKVLLKGHFSDELMNRMETLFHPIPHLWINGEKQIVTGQLMIVTDKPFSAAKEILQHQFKQEEMWQHLAKKYLKTDVAAIKTLCEETKLGKTYIEFETAVSAVTNAPNANPLRSLALLEKNHQLALSKIKSFRKTPATKVEPDVYKRRMRKLINKFNHSPYVFLIGPSGPGKSTTILESLPEFYREEKNRDCRLYVGMDHLIEWAEQTNTNATHILFIDEANLERNGNFDIFEGLFNRPPGILKDGKFYPIGPHQKVIFAGNFSNFVGREAHTFFKNHGSVMLFKELPEYYLRSKYIEHGLKATLPTMNVTDRNTLTEVFLMVYRAMKTLFPNDLLTARDFQSMCLQAALLQQYISQFGNVEHFAKYVAMNHVESKLNPTQRQSIQNELSMDTKYYLDCQTYFQRVAVDQFKTKSYSVTPSRYPAIKLLSDALAIREMKCKAKTEIKNIGQRALFIEGPSGVGKSKLICELLFSMGLKENHDFYRLTPTHPERMLRTLAKAHQQQAIVVIDEINSFPLERALNSYLMSGGGFFVIGTGNPVNFRGRQALSPALENRLKKIQLPEYSREELTFLLQQKGLTDPMIERLIKEHEEAKQKSSRPVPMRKLFRNVELALRNGSMHSKITH